MNWERNMAKGCKERTVANDLDINQRLDLHVGRKVTNDVSLHGILADVVLSSPEARKYAITGLHGTSNLRGSFPHNLGEVRWLRVVSVVFRDFIGPGFDRLGDRETPCASGKILTQGPESATRMGVSAFISPLLGLGGSGIAPGHRHGAVLGTDRVVRIQVCLLIGRRRVASAAAAGAAAAVAVAVAVAARLALALLSVLRLGCGVGGGRLRLGCSLLGLSRSRGSRRFSRGGGVSS